MHMRQSHLFTRTRKEAPKDEVSKNAQLLIRAGYIHKEMAGVYSFLPLGLRTLKRVEQIIREEMNAIGGQEMLMSSIQDPELWKKTDRWSDEKVDVWFKSELQAGGEVGFGWTHEEMITNIMRAYVSSYRELPKQTYQFQTKFRNEIRAKSGIMRTREFVMKDLYSFSRSKEEHDLFYEQCAAAYLRIFERLGLGDRTYRTFASGGAFSKYSDEFQTVSEAGEDTIYVDEEKRIAVNAEVFTDEVLADLGLSRESLVEKKSIEVGNTFTLGTRFSDALDLTYKDENGNSIAVFMGCYGIGPARAMGAVVESCSDEKGIVWPREVAPFAAHLVVLGTDEDTIRAADSLYESFLQKGIEILYDDRDLRAGEKFTDADLLGMPFRIVVSDKTQAEGKYELSERASGESTLVGENELLAALSGGM
jgi:prolyl-tRNA synthetase